MTPGPEFPGRLEAFFTDRLLRKRRASPHTIAGYRDTFRLLLTFARQQLKKEPSCLAIEDLDAPFIGAFLDHLEQARGNSARTRNVRLAAIHSFFRYLALQDPAHGAVIQRVFGDAEQTVRSPPDRVLDAMGSPESRPSAGEGTAWRWRSGTEPAGARSRAFPRSATP